ncbi:unnamed protein product, partial [Polarella glacialis]
AKTKDMLLQDAEVQPGGQTALHLAARAGDAALADLLLGRGADPAVLDWDGVNPAVAAALQGRGGLAERLAAAAAARGGAVQEAGLLPTAQAQEVLAEAARTRAAERFGVPDNIRHSFVIPSLWSAQECSQILAAAQAVVASRAQASCSDSGVASLNKNSNNNSNNNHNHNSNNSNNNSNNSNSSNNSSNNNDGGWTTARHRAYATTDLPCDFVPAVDAWVRSSLESRLFPEMSRWYDSGNVNNDNSNNNNSSNDNNDNENDHKTDQVCPSRLAFRDLFFVRYSAAPGAQRQLEIHQDGSVMSFNILLNSCEDFEGGGTFIEADNHTYGIGQGDCFVHASKLRHGGTAITHGERYLLVGFVDVLDEGDFTSVQDGNEARA